jgi:hypothetical protein
VPDGAVPVFVRPARRTAILLPADIGTLPQSLLARTMPVFVCATLRTAVLLREARVASPTPPSLRRAPSRRSGHMVATRAAQLAHRPQGSFPFFRRSQPQRIVWGRGDYIGMVRVNNATIGIFRTCCIFWEISKLKFASMNHPSACGQHWRAIGSTTDDTATFVARRKRVFLWAMQNM